MTERKNHVDRLAKALHDIGCPIIILQGGMGKKQRKAAIDALNMVPGDKSRVLLATGRYIGEGFDDPRLDTLFLALPISWTGTLQQYVGGIHRQYVGKQSVHVYDYVDDKLPMLSRMFKKRLRGYKALGYQIEDLGNGAA